MLQDIIQLDKLQKVVLKQLNHQWVQPMQAIFYSNSYSNWRIQIESFSLIIYLDLEPVQRGSLAWSIQTSAVLNYSLNLASGFCQINAFILVSCLSIILVDQDHGDRRHIGKAILNQYGVQITTNNLNKSSQYVLCPLTPLVSYYCHHQKATIDTTSKLILTPLVSYY